MKNYLRKIKEEKGAVSALVIITVLTFIAVLLGAILTVTALRKSQLKSDMRIQDVYGADVDNVNEIYDSLINENTDKTAPTVTISMANSQDYLFAVKSTVTITDDDSGVDYEKCKYIYTTSSDEIGTDIGDYTEGSLTQSSTNIEKAKGTGTYYLHVLATDVEGNSAETVSEDAITIASTAEYDYATDTSGNGKEQTASLLPGTYQFECWGASGGKMNNVNGGYGAYTLGNIELNEKKDIYIYVGATTLVREGGYNGGGKAAGGSTGVSRARITSGGGGGATDIRIFSSTISGDDLLWNSPKGLASRIMVAAGGGGGLSYESFSQVGGNGGGLYSEDRPCVHPSGNYYTTGSNQTESGIANITRNTKCWWIRIWRKWT